MHKLSIVTPGMISRSYDLRPGMNRIGRNPLNDHVFNDPAISGFHCEIEVTNQGISVRDLGSTNGTFINRQAIKESPFLPGQSIRLGQVELMLDAAPAPISIPQLTVPEPEHPNSLPDGTPACQNHASLRATLQCVKCQRTFCIDCVRFLGRAGGRKLRFCPVCGGNCEPLAPLESKQIQKQSLFSRLSRSIMDRFQNRP